MHNPHGIPEHTLQSLGRYLEHGLHPGGFLTNVLTNNLFGAAGSADSSNQEALIRICRHIWNEVPAAAWGSEEKFEAWMQMKRQERGRREEG